MNIKGWVNTALSIIFCAILMPFGGCTSTITTQPSLQPIEVISISDTYENGQTISPGGPSIMITLKNISSEPVVSLNVTLDELGERLFDFDFEVSLDEPLKPGKRISSERRLIGGGWGGGIPYNLRIFGKTQSGKDFDFIWEP